MRVRLAWEIESATVSLIHRDGRLLFVSPINFLTSASLGVNIYLLPTTCYYIGVYT